MGGGSTPAGGSPRPTQAVTGSQAPTPTPAFSAIPNGGPTGQPIAGPADFGRLLGPGDFAAVGLPGAEEPTINATGCTTCAFIVYKGNSAAGGGYELDIFLEATVEEADNDFGGGDMSTPNMEPLRPVQLRELGADKALYDPSAEGNDESIKFASLLAQKGRVVFTLGIPAGPHADAQIMALGKLVISRIAALV
jgi:hypothetical protein